MTNKALIAGMGGIVFVAIAGAAIWYVQTPADEAAQAAAAAAASLDPEPIPTVPETRLVSEGWRSYENRDFHFGFLFPDGLAAKEYAESGGAMSAIFEDPATGQGFQVYVTPYGESQITQERFQLDEPSGVMDEPTNVVIAGAPATMFFSRNSIMGDTREVWFIKDGLLYEVVTYKQLDAWLSQIMQTWKFI